MGDSHKDDRYNDGQYNSDNRENIDNKGNSEAADASAGGTGNLNFRKFYLFTLAVLGALSAYPLINGVRIAYIGVMHGAVEPGQYARYVIPYTAMCVAILLFAAFLPVLFRVKRMAFLVGLSGAYAVFIALELFMENIKISTKGMTVLDPASLTADMTAPPFASVDIWQASMCAVSPLVRGQSKVFSSGDGIFYVMANDAYKIHYYLVSFILITMVCGLVYGIGHAVSTGAEDRRKPLILQGMAAAALVSLCVFANTTAFFRQTGPIQTPAASVLTCLFFIMLGTSTGVYAGSFFLKRGRAAGVVLPILISVVTVAMMYAGEAAMMDGGLYRFGTGWFFDGLPGISLAPVDILVVLITGAVTWLVLHFARRFAGWPGKSTAVIAGVSCLLVFGTGIAFAIPRPTAGGSILGSYVFDECLYMNPLSSFLAMKGNMPYIYELSEEGMTVRNTKTGDIELASVRYEDTAVDEGEFDLITVLPSALLPDISKYRDCRRRAVINFENGLKYNFYTMDGEAWLVRLGNEKIGIWSIYRLKKVK